MARLTPALVPLYLALVGRLVVPSWRRYLVQFTRDRLPVSITLATVFASSLLFTARVVASHFRALKVNAWDFSAFDLPIQRSLVSTFLYSPIDHRSFLGTHASYVLALFVPLHALYATPVWLLGTQALAISAATAASWLVFRDLLQDDIAALLLSVAYLLNTYTAKTLQYVFHVEVLYPALLFVLVHGLLRRRVLQVAAATLFLLSVKEDALLLLVGISISLLFVRPRRWRTASLLIGAGVLVYLVSTRVVMPHAAGAPPGHPWYATYWAAYGETPLLAVRGMILHPLQVAQDLWLSGIRDLLEPLLFLPLFGGTWFLAAVPALTVYGTASNPGVAHFGLYYSSPVLPFLFIAAAVGVRRFARLVPMSRIAPVQRQRIVAFALLGVSALSGASYVFPEPNSRRSDVPDMVAASGARPLRVQGSLLPHAGYAPTTLPLDTLTSDDAVLLDDSSDPYPFSREELRSLAANLVRRGYRQMKSKHGLLLLMPP